MAESRTWAIILALQAQLQTITAANGYLTDVGTNVWVTNAQRTDENALGLMIYTESIDGSDAERPGKPVRGLALLVEAAIGTDLDAAQQRIHALTEDIEACMQLYTKAQYAKPPPQQTPLRVAAIAILDRPEGAPVIAMQARIVAEYFR